MVSIGERLREERARLSLNQTEFAALASVTKKTQMLYESDERSPKADYLAALAESGVDVRYVLTGEKSEVRYCPSSGDQAVNKIEDSDQSVSLAFEARPGYSPVPMYDIEAAAGDGRFFEAENIETTVYFETTQLKAEGLDADRLVGAKVRGDSMGDTLRDGDQVLVDRSKRQPDGVFLLRMGDELRIKRVQRVAGGAWLLISDNPLYDKELIKPEDMREIEIIGRCEIRIGRVS